MLPNDTTFRQLPPALQQWILQATETIRSPEKQDQTRAELAQHARALYDELTPQWGDAAAEQTLLRLGSAEQVAQQYLHADSTPERGQWKKLALVSAVCFLVAILAGGYFASLLGHFTPETGQHGAGAAASAATFFANNQAGILMVALGGFGIGAATLAAAIRAYRTQKNADA